MTHVVVAGGGFAGLNAARTLGRARQVEVTLVDRRNHHLFQPLLYQVAMAGLSPAEISAPIRSLLSRQENTRVRHETVVPIDAARRELRTESVSLPYDYLVVATGAGDAYFGHDDWEAHAPGLKSLEQALLIRRRVLTAYERAEIAVDPEQQRALLTFVVVGGGPTGVELAGALGEMSRFTLTRDFRNIDPKRARVILIEGGPRILPTFAERLASRATRDLERLGVQVWTSSPVTAVDAEGVAIGSERLRAATTLWAAGVRASEVGATLGVPLDDQGRVRVAADLSVEGHSEIFVAGDLARADDANGEAYPGLAPVALQQGRFVAKAILRELSGRPRGAFRYVDRGTLATIGRRSAVGQFGRLRVVGSSAWILWLVVHIYYLVGFKNRLFVVLQWAWSYLRFRRGARLIVNRE